MKLSIAITLDGLVTALRYRGHAAADEAEFELRRRDGVKPRGEPKATVGRGETRGERDDDVAGG